ncbi:MAG: TRAP transporter fused permease subunit [Candidatus Rokubacteria bacterium]|nr:TRAP transporter fused permease subunit [Candidatus Rokubacteria bacterium]
MRKLSGLVGWGVGAYAVAASLLHLYTAGYGVFEPRVMRALHLLFLVPLVFLLFPFNRRSPQHRPSGMDWAAAAVAFLASAYQIRNVERLNERWVGASDILLIEVFLGSAMVLLVIEACRRSLSRWMAVTIAVFLLYLATAPWMPGLFHFKGYTFPRMVEMMFLAGDEGIFGFLTGISANILFIYVLFACVMMKAGVGNFLMDFAVRAAGWMRGGPAKIAVVGSAFFGTISGSTVANVYATGSFTIPLMKRAGYAPKTAAAIEAIAGTGGQIMPPIMGAGAFIMSEVTGVSYFDIIKAAAVPAILYYVGVFSMVHFIALRTGMRPVSKSELPSWRPALRRGYYFLPFALIVYFLAWGYSPTKAAFYVILITLALSYLDRSTRMTPRKFAEALVEAAVGAATIAVALAGSGMVVGTLTRTGAALAFGGVVVSAAQGILVIAMILIFVVVSVLGTGIPTTAAYIIAVTVGAAALGNLGVPVLAAHLFVFYYAVLSDLTPPDAVTAFAAANIAGSEMMATGVEAFRLGIAGFLVPFAFVFHPELLLQGSWPSIILMSAFAGCSAVALAAALVGHGLSALAFWERGTLLVAAALMVVKGMGTQLVGVALFGAVLLWSARRRPTPVSATGTRPDSDAAQTR